MLYMDVQMSMSMVESVKRSSFPVAEMVGQLDAHEKTSREKSGAARLPCDAGAGGMPKRRGPMPRAARRRRGTRAAGRAKVRGLVPCAVHGESGGTCRARRFVCSKAGGAKHAAKAHAFSPARAHAGGKAAHSAPAAAEAGRAGPRACWQARFPPARKQAPASAPSPHVLPV